MAASSLIVLAVFASCIASTLATGPFLDNLPNIITVKHFPVNPVNKPPAGMNATDPAFTPLLLVENGLLNITWALDTTSSNTTAPVIASFKYAMPYICFAPGLDRPWRKRNNNLAKDNQCKHKAVDALLPYTANGSLVDLPLHEDIPTAKYFVRVYFYDVNEKQVAWGQSCKFNLSSPIQPPPLIKGQPFKAQKIDSFGGGLIAAAVCFSVLSVSLLVLVMTYDLVYKKKSV